MFFLTPKYLKHAKLLLKGVTRFLDYKRDILAPKRLAEIEDLRLQLKRAIRERDSKRIDELTDAINRTCERALPDARMSAWAENIEVFFVSIVIAMGIRTYVAQPFKIPTGSMQPTLNGYTVEATDNDPTPALPKRIAMWFAGATYINAVSDHDGELTDIDPLTEHNFLLFFPYCLLHFKDGHTISISAPYRQLMDSGDLGLPEHTNLNVHTGNRLTPDGKPEMVASGGGPMIHKGQVLARGILHGGDQVIVNKFAYHFRKPSRGEVFVFTTKNIDGIWNTMSEFDREGGSQHYIKRLAGVPGDTLNVRSPMLFINGQKATDLPYGAFGFKRVIEEAVPIDSLKPRSQQPGYHGYSPDHLIELPITLAAQPMPPDAKNVVPIPPGRQYFAMGDNSYNSSDSRFWGPVPEKNVVGPGWLCYWPITSHWGLIR